MTTQLTVETGISLLLPSGKRIDTQKHSHYDQWFFSGPADERDTVCVFDFIGLQGKDFPNQTVVEIHEYNDVVLNNTDGVCLKKFDNKLVLQVQLCVYRETWKKFISIEYLPKYMVDILLEQHLPLVNNESVGITDTLFDHLFEFSLGGNQDIGKTVRQRLIDFQLSYEKACQTIDSLGATLHDKSRLLNLDASSGIGVNPSMLRRFVTSKRLPDKTKAYLVVILLFVIFLIGVSADLKELFG